MSDKKHVDRLFQEKLKDFEVTPDKAVWDKINSQLSQKKEDRKVIPFWWKFVGVAASLILLLTVGNLVFNDSENPTKVVDTENITKDSNISNDKNNTLVKSDDENFNNKSDNSVDESLQNKDEVVKPDMLNNNNSVANSDTSTNTQGNQTKSKSDQGNYKNKTSDNSTDYLVNVQQDDVPESNNSSEQPSNIIKKDKSPSLNQDVNKETEALAVNKIDKSNEIKKSPSDNLINTNKEERLVFDDENDGTPLNKGIVENSDVDNEKEEELVIEEEKDKIELTEEILANNEETDEKEKEQINRWQINPNIAPVYFNSFGKGSPIHEELVENDKSGEINMSYGVNVSYAVNNKLSIKSGVNRVNLGYNTNDIFAYENLGENMASTDLFRNIKFNDGRLPQLSFLSKNSVSLRESSPTVINKESSTYINQEMTYYEIPLEVKYKLSDRKLGVSLVSGFSTFILSDNKISYELEGVDTELGEASNLNDISYSANIGFGLDYKLSKSMSFNLDPMLKYQINTFSNSSGDFKPYFIGVYSGINIKF